MLRALLMTSALLLATPASAEILSGDGVGPVRLGMNVKAAEQALKDKVAA